MKALRIGFIFSTMALVCFLFACAEMTPTATPEKKTTIRIGSPFKSGTIVVDAAEKFKELVEKGSGGRIEVKIDAGTKAEIEINKMNRAGELEMQSNGTNFLELYAPPYYFFTGPYVMKDFDHYMRAWNGKARPAGAGRAGEERPEVPGDHLPRAAADDGEETALHASGCV